MEAGVALKRVSRSWHGWISTIYIVRSYLVTSEREKFNHTYQASMYNKAMGLFGSTVMYSGIESGFIDKKVHRACSFATKLIFGYFTSIMHLKYV